MQMRIIIGRKGGVLTNVVNMDYLKNEEYTMMGELEDILPSEVTHVTTYVGRETRYSARPLNEPYFLLKHYCVFEISERDYLKRKMLNQTFLKFLNGEIKMKAFNTPFEIFIQEVEV